MLLISSILPRIIGPNLQKILNKYQKILGVRLLFVICHNSLSEKQKYERIEYILDCGANPNGVGQKTSPLHWAVAKEYYSIVKLLLEKWALVDSREALRSCTPLHIASFKGNKEIAQLLLKYGAHVNAQETVLGYAPFHFAVVLKKPSLLVLLLENNADVSIKDNFKNTVFDLANDEEIIDILSGGNHMDELKKDPSLKRCFCSIM